MVRGEVPNGAQELGQYGQSWYFVNLNRPGTFNGHDLGEWAQQFCKKWHESSEEPWGDANLKCLIAGTVLVLFQGKVKEPWGEVEIKHSSVTENVTRYLPEIGKVGYGGFVTVDMVSKKGKIEIGGISIYSTSWSLEETQGLGKEQQRENFEQFRGVLEAIGFDIGTI